MPPPLPRRRFLRAAGAALATGLAGCDTARGPGATPGTATNAGTATPASSVSPPSSPTPAATPTPNPDRAVEREYSIGEWHAIRADRYGPWEFTFAAVEFATTFRFDRRAEEQSMPPDRQLVVATTRATCVGSEHRLYSWGSMPFAVVTGDGAYEDQPSFEHPSFHVVASDEIARIEHRGQYRPEGQSAYPDETVTTWWLFVVPRDVTRADAAIGYDPDGTDAVAYPVRWVLEGR